MRLAVRFALLVSVTSSCTGESRSEPERLAEAARADSSAAGYDVGASGPSESRSPRSVVASGPPAAVAPRSQGRSVGLPDTTSMQQVIIPPIVATVPLRGGQPGRQPGAIVDTSPTGSDSLHGEPRVPPVREADFLTYVARRRALTFQLAAGDTIPGRVSFNGSTQGVRVLTVPRGWTVTIKFVNRDPAFPHSAVVVSLPGAIPETLPAAAFPGARTVRVQEGLLDGSADELTFVAARSGRYLLACGVFGHAQRGQWLSLVVSAAATVPSYR